MINACTPRIITNEDVFSKQDNNDEKTLILVPKQNENILTKQNENSLIKQNENVNLIDKDDNKKLLNEIEVILPDYENYEITINFINALELSLYKKNINNLSFNINTYYDEKDLNNIINKKIKPGKIFIGPLTSKDTQNIKKFCDQGVIFFSFASDRKLASDCVYLINFFPEDDLNTLFDFFDSNDRIALLYPENHYGYYINNIIDEISDNSKSMVVSKIPYKEDLTNAREAIKNLGQYELRRYELERQKKILQSKNDDISKKALEKIEKFETIGELDFTHVIIADYNIRLLEIAPLLPFYDIDPNRVQFVGTGVWDDEAFFDEPSLQKAIFPGIVKDKRIKFINEYIETYYSEPIRTATIIYDLIGLINYLIENQLTVRSTFSLIDNQETSFEGIDGRFSFNKNLIKRDLNILQILNGKASFIE